MANGPHIEISGNLTRDPELRFTPNGHAVAKITVAHTPRKRDVDGNWSDGTPQYWDVTAWRQLAENVAESLVRGDSVTIIGTVDFREWEDKEGNKRHQHEINADVISVPLTFQTVRIRRANRNGNGSGNKSGKPASMDADTNADGMSEFASSGK